MRKLSFDNKQKKKRKILADWLNEMDFVSEISVIRVNIFNWLKNVYCYFDLLHELVPLVNNIIIFWHFENLISNFDYDFKIIMTNKRRSGNRYKNSN